MSEFPSQPSPSVVSTAPVAGVGAPAAAAQPVIGQILMGGSLSGALVRDVRLANELARRGYRVHVWWAGDRQRFPALDPAVQQHWLFHGYRYADWWPLGRLRDRLGRALSAVFSDRARALHVQKHRRLLNRLMRGVIRAACADLDRHDPRLVGRFAAELDAAGVTHLLPMLEVLCAWGEAARRHMHRPCRYVVTFQGYELYANYARPIGMDAALYQRLAELVERSNGPAIAVSPDYLERVADEVGVPARNMRPIPPGVPKATPMAPEEAHRRLDSFLGPGRPGVPLVSYLGRQDVEKGIDLLLYAAAILRRQGVDFQLAIAGPTLFGREFRHVIRQLSDNLRLPVRYQEQLPEPIREALLAASHCVVYPSIHREPFGMVATEALSYGTPAIVPDHGGVAGAIRAQGQDGGLTFKAFDSGDLARQIARLLQDAALHQRLAAAGPAIAEHYSVPNLADRVLAHLALPAAASR